MPTDSLERRFWRKVQISDPDECWLWAGAKNASNRGHIRLGRASDGYAKAPRVAFFLCHGYWPTQANHLCDNMFCCNPLHIYEGTQLDNVLDMVARGRRPVGPLPAEQVIAIRSIYRAGGVSQRELGIASGLTQSHVSAIVRGAAYGRITQSKIERE